MSDQLQVEKWVTLKDVQAYLRCWTRDYFAVDFKTEYACV